MRLQVFLSHNGVSSRRGAMDIIQQGRVRVDGLIVREPSFEVNGSEKITCDDKLVVVKTNTYLMLHKPTGYTTTKEDPHADKTVLDLLPKELHYLSPVGRLDRDTEGLLLLTNDGDLAFKLTHPKFHLDKTYIVSIKGRLTKESQKDLQSGIVIEGGKTAPCRIEELRYNDAGTNFKMTIHEGKKRQIRLMLREVGHQVVFLKRISIGNLSLGDLKVGTFRHLTEKEVNALLK